MLKNILKLEGAQQLSKSEQKEIAGGTEIPCDCVYWLAECQLAASQGRRCRIPARCMYCTA